MLVCIVRTMNWPADGVVSLQAPKPVRISRRASRFYTEISRCTRTALFLSIGLDNWLNTPQCARWLVSVGGGTQSHAAVCPVIGQCGWRDTEPRQCVYRCRSARRRHWFGGVNINKLSAPRLTRLNTVCALHNVVAPIDTPSQLGQRRTVMSMSVCLCLSVSKDISGTTRSMFTRFLCMLPVAVAGLARSSTCWIATRYVFQVYGCRHVCTLL